MHDQEVKRSVSCLEGSFPLVTGSNANKVVSAMEVDLGEDTRILEAVQEVWNEWERVSVFPCNCVQATPIYTEAQGTVFLLDK